MTKSREEILNDVMELLEELSEDWTRSQPLTPQTLLFSELELESLDAVVLGTALQERYQKEMPFAKLLADIGEQQRDLSVSELVGFVDAHLNPRAEEAPSR